MKFGIDISYYQDGIDLSKAKSEGVKFAILRAGFTGYGDGLSKYKDTSFETFYNQCKSLNIPVGAYWFSCANSYEKGVNEAKFMYENCLKNKQFARNSCSGTAFVVTCSALSIVCTDPKLLTKGDKSPNLCI